VRRRSGASISEGSLRGRGGGVAEDARGVAEHHEQENLHANNDIMWQL